MFIPGEEVYALFAVFVALTLILVHAVSITRSVENAGIEMRMNAVADGLADALAKKCLGQDGSFDLGRLGNMVLGEKEQVKIAGHAYGADPPNDASVYTSKRVVFLDGEPTALEVKIWK